MRHVTGGGSLEELSKVAHVWSQSRGKMKIYRSDDKDRVCESVHEQKSLLLLLKELRNLQNRPPIVSRKKNYNFGVPFLFQKI